MKYLSDNLGIVHRPRIIRLEQSSNGKNRNGETRVCKAAVLMLDSG